MNKKYYNKTRSACFLILLLSIAHIFLGNSSAPPQDGRTGAPGDGACTNCHTGNNPEGLDGSLTISGLPNEVMPNMTYRVTVEVANPNGLSQTAGMQMVALNSQDQNAGSFSNPSSGAGVTVNFQSLRNYLGHKPAQPYDLNRISSFSADWTSPADPDPNVTFYAAANVTDSNFSSSTGSDLILFETKSVAVVGDVMVDLPDLTAGNAIGFAGTYAPDEVVEFSWDLINLGQAVAVDNYRIVMYLSDDTQFSADDVVVGEVPTGNTFPGTISGVPGAIRVPIGQADGDYYLIFSVDNDNDIEESDETNNLVTTTTTITVAAPVALEVDLNATPDCIGNVALESIVAGGELPFTYNWSTGEATADIVVTTTGDYAVTVTDGAQEQVVVAVSVTVPDELILDAVINQQPNGSQQGQIEIFISGGTLPYNISWSDGFAGTVNSGLQPGTYDVTVTDANGCFSTIQVVLEGIVQLPDLTAGNVVGFEGMYAQDEVVEFTWDLINLGEAVAVDNYRIVMYLSDDQVFSADDAMVGEVPTGNTFPGTISGVPGAIRVPINQADGEYFLHFFVDNDDVIEESDETNNIITTSSTITVGEEVSDLMVTATVSQLTCSGSNDASISLETNVSATFVWSTGATTSSIMNLSAGPYAVTVTSMNNDEVIRNYTITQINPIDLITEVQSVNCFGGMDGQIDVLATGGTGPYTYAWSNGATNNNIANLDAGDYTLTVTDANACQLFTNFELDEPAELEFSLEVIEVTCFGLEDGIISVTSTTGGIPPYIYEIDYNTSYGDFMGLEAGSYTVSVTDINGCVVSEIVEVESPTELTLELSVSDVLCPNGDDGSASISGLTGGTPPYTYIWSNGETTTIIDNLVADLYTVTVTDANGCEAISPVSVAAPSEIMVSLESFTTTENGACLNAEFIGPSPFTYLWSNGATTPQICNLDPGTYSVTITDANGCESFGSGEVISTSIAGISELNDWDLYPSPAQNLLNIEVQLDQSADLRVELASLNGQYMQIPTATFHRNGLDQKATIDISSIDSGIYLLILSTDQGREVKRFVKL